MADNLENIQLLFTKRNAVSRGRISSEDFNDMIEELSHDLVEFNTQWNNRLVALTSTIPDGTDDADVDAITNGLSGRHLYADADATSVTNTSYYSTSSSRPRTILEQFSDVYSQITSVQNSLEEQIAGVLPTAEQVIISDTGGLYTSTNVETALAEAMTAVNSLAVDILSRDVTKVGTPLDNQIGVWTGDGTIEGDADLTWNGTSLYVGTKIGIGVSSPQNELDVEGAVAIGASYSGTDSAPTDGLIVEGKVGIGVNSVTEKLEVNGAVKLGTTNPGADDGTIRWTGTDFEGRKAGAWVPISNSMTKVGTPVNNQIAVWTGDGTVEGDTDFTWDGTDLIVNDNITAWNTYFNTLRPRTDNSGMNTVHIGATTDRDYFFNFRRGGGSPIGKAGIILSNLSTSHYFVYSDDAGLNISYSTENSNTPDVDSATSRLVMDSSGNLGIGTSLPDTNLHIYNGTAGAVTATANTVLTIENNTHCYTSFLAPDASEKGILFGEPSSSTAGGIIYNHPNTVDGLQFRTNGNNTKMVIDDSGNVGIDTTSPNTSLHVKGADNSTYGQLQIESTGNDARLSLYNVDGAATTGRGDILMSKTSGYEGLRFMINGADKAIIDENGNVGIGAASPSSKLHIRNGVSGASVSVHNDDIFVENNGNVGIALGCPNTSWGSLMFCDPEGSQSGGLQYDHFNDRFYLRSGNTQTVVITSGGVGIGTIPSYKLHVANGASGAAISSFSDDIVVENSLTAGITIAAGTSTSYSQISFAEGVGAQWGAIQYQHEFDRLFLRAGNTQTVVVTSSGVGIGIGANSPSSKVEVGLATENLEIVDAGSAAATEQDWIEVQVGGVTGYIRVYASK